MREAPRQQELMFDNKQAAQLRPEQREQVVGALAALVLSSTTHVIEKSDEAHWASSRRPRTPSCGLRTAIEHAAGRGQSREPAATL